MTSSCQRPCLSHEHGLCLSDAFREAESKARDLSQVTRDLLQHNCSHGEMREWRHTVIMQLARVPMISQLESRREHLILGISSCAQGGRMGKVLLIFGFDLGTESCLKGLSSY